jgi:hypothetical protein
VHDGKIAWLHLSSAFAVEHDGRSRREVRLADEKLASLGDFYDD